jgi:hypothetical protein
MWAWQAVSWSSVVAIPVLVALYVPERPLVAAALMAFLPIQRVNVRLPVLVDAPAMALALGAAVALQRGHWALAVALATIGGGCKETAPIFAALYAWSWLPLMGLVALLGIRTAGKPDGDPFSGRGTLNAAKVILAQRRHDFLSWTQTLLPWGAVLPMYVLAGPAWKSLVTVAVGYGQLLIATDKARLFQWAAPPVIAVAAHGASGPWLAVALIAHAFNPYRGV